MVCPDMLVMMSPGRVALPEGMFSVSPMRPTALTAALRPASASMRPATQAAPPMSPFMSSMPAAGFMEMPPVSKHTPLPTKASVLARLDLAPCHCSTTTREGRSLPCPTDSSAPILWALRSSSSSTWTSSPARVRSRMRSANSTGPSMLAGSLTRSRARKTPSATAFRAANALAAASGLAQCTTSLRKPLGVSSSAPSSVLRVMYFLKL